MKKFLLAVLIIGLSLSISATAIAGKACDYVVYDRNDTSVNLRQSPNGNIILKIPNGVKITTTGKKGTWYSVRLDDFEGYIKQELLWLSDSCYAFDDQDTYVNLREKASINSRVLRRVNNGTPLTCLDDIPSNPKTWIKVRVEDGTNKVGYMYGTKVGEPTCP